MADPRNINKGALWRKVSKNGLPFYSGYITLSDGVEYRISVFKNEYKDDEKKPDMRIVVDPPADLVVKHDRKPDAVQPTPYGGPMRPGQMPPNDPLGKEKAADDDVMPF